MNVLDQLRATPKSGRNALMLAAGYEPVPGTTNHCSKNGIEEAAFERAKSRVEAGRTSLPTELGNAAALSPQERAWCAKTGTNARSYEAAKRHVAGLTDAERDYCAASGYSEDRYLESKRRVIATAGRG